MELQADGPFEVLCREKGKDFVYRRGNLVIAVNPKGKTEERTGKKIFSVETKGKGSFAVWEEA